MNRVTEFISYYLRQEIITCLASGISKSTNYIIRVRLDKYVKSPEYKCTKTQLKCTCITHGGRVTHIYVGRITIMGSDDGLSPGRFQPIIWTSAKILLSGPVGTNKRNIHWNVNIFIQGNAFENVVCEMVAILSRGRWVKWKRYNPSYRLRFAAINNRIRIILFCTILCLK